ncbi:DUF2971 domain-containing protein [Weeksellaceae bacterium TAE3-ERU29]|nr:DUF2971 domain-containing protein [Weeksellaceae bacterium TAE3-ERU29]
MKNVDLSKKISDEINNAIQLDEDERIITEYPIGYKYRDWSNNYHKEIITRKELYFPTYSDFNDKFDMQRPFRFDNNLSFEEWKKVLEKEDEKEFYSLTEEKLEIMFDKYKSGIDWREYYETHLGIMKNFGVYSLSKNNNNDVMWAHYSNNSKGFCIGFDIRNIQNILFRCIIREVKYLDKEIIMPHNSKNKIDTYLDLFITKNNKWSYEEEIRIFKTWTEEDRKIKLDENSIKEIIFGIDTSKEDMKEIIEEVNKNFSNVSFYQIEKDIEFSKLTATPIKI